MKLKKFLLAATLIAALIIGGCHRAVQHDVSLERKATHLIAFVEVNEETGVRHYIHICTATAVGPHALLTATHCIEGVAGDTIELDLSPKLFHVDAGVTDDRDHVILHVPDFTFTNRVVLRERIPVIGEHVRSYGDGRGDYPPHARLGVVIPDVYEGDLSDVDKDVHVTNYSFASVPGDSGSAVYGVDGAIVGVVSYSRGEEDDPDGYTTGMALDFSKEVIAEVSQF